MTIRNSPSPANTRGHFAGVMRLSTNRLGRSSLILASLVLAAAITLPRAAFAAPAGTPVGQSPTLTPAGGKDPLISFGFNIGGNSGFGTLQATPFSGGQFQATSGTLTMSSTSTGDANNTYCLVPGAIPPAPPAVLTSPLGLFIYDDLVQPAMNPAFPDIYGLLFSNTAAACGTGFSGNHEINIWSGPQSGPPAPDQYSFYDGQGGGGYPIAYTTPTGVVDSFNAIVGNPTTYSYSGKAFNLFECASSPNPDCSMPGLNNPYGPKDSVTAALVLAAPLCATAGSCPLLSNVINVCSASNANPTGNLLNLILNDGVNTLTATCPTPTGAGAGATAWVTTDANGNINAWYLDVTVGGGSADIHTLYDPSGAIATACGNCYFPNSSPQDKGTQGSYYGYVNSQGLFTPPGQGGVTTAGNCTAASPCQNSPVASTVVTVPPDVPFPTAAPIVEAAYYIQKDPRGPNCGYNGSTGQPTSLDLSTVQVSTGPGMPTMSGSFLGHETIPWNICIPEGGAWVDYAVDETLASINGVNVYPNFVPPTPWASDMQPDGTNNLVACLKTGFKANSGYTFQLTASAPRAASLTEEQEPEQVGSNGIGTGTGLGPPQFIPSTRSCDSGTGTGRPARSIWLFNVQFIAPNPLARHTISGTATNQQILVAQISQGLYFLRNGLMPLIKFNPASVGTTLQACYTRVNSLISNGNYNCAAYQTYQCDQILKGTPVAEVGPSNSVLRLPDPWGDLHSRNLGMGFLLNAAAGNDTTVSLDDPNVLSAEHWPPPPASCPTH